FPSHRGDAVMPRETVLKCFGVVPILVFAITLTGCGRGSGGPNTVSGTVMYGGQPVTGSVVFIDGANKEHASPIAPDGKYRIPDLPTGSMKVLVRGTPNVAPGPKTKATISPAPTN